MRTLISTTALALIISLAACQPPSEFRKTDSDETIVSSEKTASNETKATPETTANESESTAAQAETQDSEQNTESVKKYSRLSGIYDLFGHPRSKR